MTPRKPKKLKNADTFLRESMKIYIVHLDAIEVADQSWVKKCACLFCSTLRKVVPKEERDRLVAGILG